MKKSELFVGSKLANGGTPPAILSQFVLLGDP